MSARVIDGKAMAQTLLMGLRERIRALPHPPKLAILADPDEIDSSFIKTKLRAAETLGVKADVLALDATSTTRARQHINRVVRGGYDGVVLQLPLPSGLESSRQSLLRVVPERMDVDCISEAWFGRMITGRMEVALGNGAAILVPPVVGAVSHILKAEDVSLQGKHAVVVGWGDLVGKPVALWLQRGGATVTVATSSATDLSGLVSSADILVSGTGRQGLISADMVREGAVVLDAGTSEASGSVRGDVDFAEVCKKASIITPVPGGIGPLTVAALFENLVSLCEAGKA